MRRNDSKECATCQALTCDPCPEMAGEDGAVLGLLERLPRPRNEFVEGTYPVLYERMGDHWTVCIYDFSKSYSEGHDPVVRSEAATLYQALLLAEGALDENEAAADHEAWLEEARTEYDRNERLCGEEIAKDG